MKPKPIRDYHPEQQKRIIEEAAAARRERGGGAGIVPRGVEEAVGDVAQGAKDMANNAMWAAANPRRFRDRVTEVVRSYFKDDQE